MLDPPASTSRPGGQYLRPQRPRGRSRPPRQSCEGPRGGAMGGRKGLRRRSWAGDYQPRAGGPWGFRMWCRPYPRSRSAQSTTTANGGSHYSWTEESPEFRVSKPIRVETSFRASATDLLQARIRSIRISASSPIFATSSPAAFEAATASSGTKPIKSPTAHASITWGCEVHSSPISGVDPSGSISLSIFPRSCPLPSSNARRLPRRSAHLADFDFPNNPDFATATMP